MLRVFLIIILFTCAACIRPEPINPATGGPIVDNVEELEHEQKVALQEEMIKRQEEEKRRLEDEYLRLKQQEHYNLLTERFKN